jgi:quinol-cytochrome oxidoreductase complex cytochrome b subunit
MRIFWFEILIVFTPFILYRLYVAFVVRKKVESAGRYNETPLALLFVIGLILASLTLIVIGMTRGSVIGGDYTPATFEDGEVKPPHLD